MITLTLIKPSGSATPTENLSDFLEKINKGEMLWVDVESPTEDELGKLQSRFQLDSYAIEDIVHGNQVPKLEDYGKNVFGVIHIPSLKNHRVEITELFIFFQDQWLITIHKKDSELIHSVDSRVKTRGLSPLSSNPSPDLLFYNFIDFAVDAYYPILDEIEERLEELDKSAVETFKTGSNRLGNIAGIASTVGRVKRELMLLRRSLTPTRDMLGMVMRGTAPFVSDSSLKSFRDVYDHSFQLLESIDADRDRTSDVRDLYISLQSASTNNIIKILTIIATFFLPLSLLAGIYGMNFTSGFFEPGSSDPLGFYVMIVAMIVIALGVLFTFKVRRWF